MAVTDRGAHARRDPHLDVTWIGHATAAIDVAGHRVLTDPLLTNRVAHLRRSRPVPDDAVDDVDTILLSHVHLDHLHLPSLKRLRPSAHVLTPRGSGKLLTRAGFTDVTEVDPGDRLTGGPIEVRVVPAEHKHGRGPHSRVQAPPVGYVVEGGGHRVYFPGDTDLFDEMAELGPIDVALLPIWGWGPSLGTGHLNPDRAATATRIIRPELVVPIHWGTYRPENGRRRSPDWFHTPPSDFEHHLDRIDEADRLRVLEPGDRLQLVSR